VREGHRGRGRVEGPLALGVAHRCPHGHHLALGLEARDKALWYAGYNRQDFVGPVFQWRTLGVTLG
jgi:hypothetical protein